jgi:hypothetical protein
VHDSSDVGDNGVVDSGVADEVGTSSAGTNADTRCGDASTSDASDNASDAGSGKPTIAKFGGGAPFTGVCGDFCLCDFRPVDSGECGLDSGRIPLMHG